MYKFDFEERLVFSGTYEGEPLEEVIKKTLPGTNRVIKADLALDKTGTDYIAFTDLEVPINIDVKKRERDCSRFWKSGDELALETWSVMPQNGDAGKIGWTLDNGKTTDYIFFIFDPADSKNAWLMPFQLLKAAFVAKKDEWYETYKHAEQKTIKPDGTAWYSECIFVPAHWVISAINRAMQLSLPHGLKTNQLKLFGEK